MHDHFFFGRSVTAIGRARQTRLMVLLALMCFAVAPLPARAELPPSQEALHKLYADAQYKPLLAQLNKALALSGPLATSYDKVDLAILKTNTLIMMKQPLPAVAASGEAVKNITATTAPDEIAQARALQVLVTASPKGIYVPKSDGGKPLPLDTTPREELLKALLTDRQAADDAAKTKAAQSINAVIDAVKQVSQTRWVELAATKSDTASQQALDDLATTAQGLLSDAIPPMAARVKAINDNANGFRVVQHDEKNHINWGVPATKSLQPADVRELKADIAACNKISSTCSEFATLSKDHADDFRTISTAASRTSTRASELLKQFRIQ
ncbi:hypothetical protein BH10PLA1_BH10PLA1_20030 [soil metagenome]